MHRHVVAHGDHLAAAVEDRAGIVATLFDVGRERGATQRCAHLFGDGVEEIFEDFKLDGIAPHDASECSATRVRGFSRRNRKVPGTRKRIQSNIFFKNIC